MSPAPKSPSPFAASSGANVPFKNSVWRPVLACGGALGLGLLAAPLLVHPAVSTPQANGSNLPEITMPSENTLIVQPSMPPGALLRGQIKLVADITGKAPVRGAVARQIVDAGAHVKKGDAVLEISSGEAERPAPAVEAVQNQAEKSQIAASDAQMALSMKIGIAQSHLHDAQDRVDRAQSQVGTARDLLRRLQNGEVVKISEIPAPYRGDSAPASSPRRRRVARDTSVASPDVNAAVAAREALRDNARDLQVAKKTLVDAQKDADAADDNMKAAVANVTAVEAKFDQKRANGADVEVARGNQKDAENTVNAADRAMIRAKLQVTKLETAADELKKAVNKAPVITAVPTPVPAEVVTDNVDASGSDSKATMSQAIKFATSALDESKRASRVAEKLQSVIQDYQSQVTTSKTRIETATQALSTAQQEVLDAVPRPHFTTAVAPADGVVTWVSRLAREVGVGQSVFGLAQGTKVGVEFKDKGELWRSIKTGSSLSAIVVTTPATAKSGATSGSNPTVSVKVTEINAPEAPGEEATVSADVSASGSSAGAPTLSAGTEVLAAVAQPGQRATLSVPLSAVVHDGDKTYLAVLAPAPQVPTSTPEADASKEEEPTSKDPVFLLRWQEVKTGRDDGFRQEIVSGLEPGTRVITLLEQLSQMGLTPDELDLPVADTGSGAATKDAGPAPIAVRLTASSA